MHREEIVVVVDAHAIEFGWEATLERGLETILEAMGIFYLKKRDKERVTLAMK